MRFLFTRERTLRMKLYMVPVRARVGHFVSGGKKSIPFKFSAKNTGVASLKSENKCALIALKVCSKKNQVETSQFLH